MMNLTNNIDIGIETLFVCKCTLMLMYLNVFLCLMMTIVIPCVKSKEHLKQYHINIIFGQQPTSQQRTGDQYDLNTKNI